MGASMGGSGGRRDSRRYRKQRFNEINITPMVDVMLVLLIIFMVAAPMLTSGVQVDLPKTSAAPLPGQDEPLTVSIQSDGAVFIQKTQVDVDSLGAKLKAIAGEKTDTRIFVKGDKAVDYGTIMRVVGAVNEAGFTKVALITEQPDGAHESRSRRESHRESHRDRE
jgi:biopolymer transport protein TolR